MKTFLVAALLAVPSCSFAAPDALFFSALQDVRRLALERKGAELLPAHESGELSRWLGWYGAMERLPKITTQELVAEISGRLRSGTRALIIGESHGIEPELDAAHAVLAEALSAFPSALFIREKSGWDDDAFLESRGVPIRTYKRMFVPAEEIQSAHKAAGAGLLVSYSGFAHSADRLKDYSLWNLEEYRSFGYKPGQTDMPTVEQAVKATGRQAVIVSMILEEYPWRRIQSLFLKRLTEPAPRLAALRAGLDSVIAAWREQIETLPATPGPISFVKDPGHESLWVGLTPASRRPMAFLAAARALAMPEAAAAIGERPIKLVEALWSNEYNDDGVIVARYRVVVHGTDGPLFDHTLDAADLN